jgi:hypothetical protein
LILGPVHCRYTMKPAPTPSKPRNPIAVALYKRHGNTVTTMRDRRAPRGGSRNKQRDYREERY